MAKKKQRKSDNAKGIYRQSSEEPAPEEWEALFAQAKVRARFPNPLDQIKQALRDLHDAGHDRDEEWKRYASISHGLTAAAPESPEVQEDVNIAWCLYCDVSRFTR
jgi:hypothetical protein